MEVITDGYTIQEQVEHLNIDIENAKHRIDEITLLQPDNEMLPKLERALEYLYKFREITRKQL